MRRLRGDRAWHRSWIHEDIADAPWMATPFGEGFDHARVLDGVRKARRRAGGLKTAQVTRAEVTWARQRIRSFDRTPFESSRTDVLRASQNLPALVADYEPATYRLTADCSSCLSFTSIKKPSGDHHTGKAQQPPLTRSRERPTRAARRRGGLQ